LRTSSLFAHDEGGADEQHHDRKEKKALPIKLRLLVAPVWAIVARGWVV
jgi:hypothetical protein